MTEEQKQQQKTKTGNEFAVEYKIKVGRIKDAIEHGGLPGVIVDTSTSERYALPDGSGGCLAMVDDFEEWIRKGAPIYPPETKNQEEE